MTVNHLVWLSGSPQSTLIQFFCLVSSYSIIILFCLISSLSYLILQLCRSSIFKRESYCHDVKSHVQKPYQDINITLLRCQHINQNRLKLSVASHTHSALTALKGLKCLYRGTPHFPFIQSLFLSSESCFFVFCLVYRPDPNQATIQIGSHLSHDIYIGSHSCLVPDNVFLK